MPREVTAMRQAQGSGQSCRMDVAEKKEEEEKKRMEDVVGMIKMDGDCQESRPRLQR